MTRKLRAFGLALVAVAAIGGFWAPGASAHVEHVPHVPAKFTAPKDTTITGVQAVNNIFGLTGIELQCESVTYVGTSSAGSESQESLTLSPQYTGCFAESIAGTINITVTGFGHLESEGEAGCDYRVNASGTLDLECKEGAEATVDAGPCAIHFPAQKGIGTLKFTNEESGGVKDVRAHMELSKITTNHTDSFGCPFPSGGESATGTVAGTTTFSGENGEGKAVGISFDATTPTTATIPDETEPTFTAPKDTTITGVEAVRHVLGLTGVEFECQSVSYVGTSSAGGESQGSLTISPRYTGCFWESVVGTINVTFTGFGHLASEAGKAKCDYRVNAGGTLDLECEEGAEATVDAGPCTIHFPAQKGIGTLKFTNEESGGVKDIRAHMELTKITTNHTDSFGCPFSGSGESATGTISGTTTFSGENGEGKAVGISFDA